GHHRHRAVAGRQGRRHRLGLRRRGQPGGLRLHGYADGTRQDGGRHRDHLHDQVLFARDSWRRPVLIGRTRSATRVRAGRSADRSAPVRGHGAIHAHARGPRSAADVVEIAGGVDMRRSTSRSRLAAVTLLVMAAGGCSRGGDRGPIAGAAAAASMTAAYGDTFIDSLLGNVSSLIPTITSDSASHEVGDRIYSGLITFDKDLNPVGDLAESWEFSKDCHDLTFRLRPGVKWRAADAFTADDVVFSWQATVDPKVPSPYKAEYELVDSVQAEGPNVVRVRYKRPFAKALTNWANAMLPKHLLEKYVHEGRIREAPQNWSAPVGTGPYRFKKLRAGEQIVLDSNPDY